MSRRVKGATEPDDRTADVESSALDLAHPDELIGRLAAARREGKDDPDAARALLRRAMERNKAALARLAE
jgi:hypothetical protein